VDKFIVIDISSFKDSVSTVYQNRVSSDSVFHAQMNRRTLSGNTVYKRVCIVVYI